ncbi:MAG TPA: hypothetical protein VI389_08200 [Geobacteraceae bacterium]
MTDDMEELSKEIKKIITDNKKFLERIMDDEFEPEEEEESGEDAVVEEL